MTDFSNSNGGIGFGGLDPGISQILQAQQSQLQQLQKIQQPSAFRRILGTVAGVAGNAFAPGIGGALGNIIGGGGGGGGLGGILGGIGGGGGNLVAGAEASLAQSASITNQLLQVAQETNDQEAAAQLASNLLKAKHATAMSVIQNIGSS
jgi:hypothetical protein